MADSFNGPALAPPASTKNQSQTSSPTLTLSVGIGNTTPVPGFPSPSSSFVPPPVVTPIEFATVKDKRKDENSRKNSKAGLANVATKSKSQLDTKQNTSTSAVDPNSIISPTTPTPNSLHRQRSFPNSESFSEVAAPLIELPTELPTDDETHNWSSHSAAKAFGAAASWDTQSPIIPTPPFSKQTSHASHSLPKTPVRTPSNPPTPSSPGFHFPPSASSRKPNRDSTMSNFSTSSVASTRSTTSLKSNRPAPPSPALSRRTSGTGVGAAASPVAKRFSAGPGGIPASGVVERSHSLRTSPTVSRNHSNSPKAALPMSSHPHRFSSPAFRRDSSTMSVPAPLPLTPVPGSATLPPVSASLLSGDLSSAGLSSAGLSSAALRTATTASTALTKGKGTGTASQMRKPIRIRDYAYVPREEEFLDARALWENDPQFLGFGADGKGLHVPTPNRVKVLNKALLTATNLSTISSHLNTAYTMWKTSYKRDRKERKAVVKRRAKETKRERAQARYSMNSVRSVGSTSSTASSVSSTSSRSEVSDVDEREDDDEDDGMGGWAGFRFGLARLSWGFSNSGASGSTGMSVSTSTSASKIATNTPNGPSASNTSNNSNSDPSSNAFPSRLDLDRNFGIDATSSESGDESSNNSTDTEGEQFHDAPSSHLRHADLDFGLDLEGRGIDSPSPLDYDRVYGYDEDAYGQIPNSAFPSASPYPGSGDGYGYEDDSLDSIGEGELIPGQYRALYSFEPEGPSEMKLTEGEIVMVVGRGGGVGWAVVVDKYTEHSPRDVEPGGTTNPSVTSKYALVPESYLELIQPDEVADKEVKEEKGTVTTPEVRQ